MSIVLIITIILVPHLARVQTITATETKASREAQAILSMLLDTVFIELIEDVEDTVLYRLSRFEETVQEPKTEDIINKEAETLAIKVYPNPAKDEVHIEFSKLIETGQISIFGLMGNIVSVLNISNSTKYVFKTENFSNGVYFYEIMVSKEIKHSGRIVIIK